MADSRESLVRTALGQLPPDTAILGGTLVNVITRELYQANVLIKGKRIASVTREDPEIGKGTVILHADGCYLAPGFIDPHMHLESSSVTATEFVKLVVPRGITTIAVDPHEIGNVLGVKGIGLLMEEARTLPINFLLRVPGKIPDLPSELETAGASLTFQETKEMLRWQQAACLAGDISPSHILNADTEQLDKVAYTIEIGKTASGYSPGLAGKELNAYIAAGLEDTHTPKDVPEVIDDIRHGLHVLLRPSTTRFGPDDFVNLASQITKQDIDTRMLSFCTDDVWIHELIREGHLDQRIKLAINSGFEPILAIQMATINTASLLRRDRDLGTIAPGRLADIIILDDLRSLSVRKVLVHGQLVAENGRLLNDLVPFRYPGWSKDTVRVARPLRADDMVIKPRVGQSEARVKVIVFEWPKVTVEETLRVRDGAIQPDQDKDILAVAVIDRHRASGRVGKGFVKGIGIRDGAVASSVNHNAHNIYAVGSSYADMALAVNHLVTMHGGYVAASNGEILAQVDLPIAGLISEEPASNVAQEMSEFEKTLTEKLKCSIPKRPLYTLAFLCAPCIPRVGLTDVGLLNTETLELEDVVLS